MKKFIITIIFAFSILSLCTYPALSDGLAPENSCYTSEMTHKDFHKAIELTEKSTGRRMEYVGKRTYFYESYYIVKALHESKGLPNLYAVPSKDFNKVFAMEYIGKTINTELPSYVFYEINPFQDTEKEVSEAVKKLRWFSNGFKSEDNIKTKEDLSKSLKETFTSDFATELINMDAFNESDTSLEPKENRDMDITLGNVKIELGSETPEERIFKIKADHIDTEAGKGIYLIEYERNYEYRQIKENGKWLFQKIKLYF